MEAPPSELDPIYAQFRDQSRFWIQRVAVPLLMVIGLFGNLITVIIMTRRGMRSTTNMYLAALAFVDMLYLVLTFILGLSHYPNMAEYKYYAYWKCRPFLMMLTDACSNTSVWLTVTFTIERYIAVKYPMKGKVWCTEKRAKMLITCVFVFGILFAAPVPFEWKVIEKRTANRQFDPRQLKNISDIGVLAKIPQNGSTLLTETTGAATITTTTTATLTTTSTSTAQSTAKMNGDLILKTQVHGDEKTRFKNGSEDNDDFSSVSIGNPIELSGQTEMEEDEPVEETRILALDYSDFGRNETYKTFYYWSIAVIFYFVPLFSLMLFNGFLIKSVHQSRRERTKMTRRTTNRHTQSPRQSTQHLGDLKDCGQYYTSDLNSKASVGSRKDRPKRICRGDMSGKKSSQNYKHQRFRILPSCPPGKHKKNRATSNAQEQCIDSAQQESLHRCPLISETNCNTNCGESSKPFGSVDDFPFVDGIPPQPQIPRATSTTTITTASHQLNFIQATQLSNLPSCGIKSNGSSLANENSAVSIHIASESSENTVLLNCDIHPTEGENIGGEVVEGVEATNDEEYSDLKTRTRSESNLSGQSNQQRNQNIYLKQQQTKRDSRDISKAHIKMSGNLPARLARSTAKRNIPEPLTTCNFASNTQSHPSSTSLTQQHQSLTPASSQERRITIMLISVVILFLFCQIPSAAMLLYTSVREMVPNTNEHALVLAFGNIFNFLVAVNAAGNFILYSFLSKKYRRTFMVLFCSCLGSKHKPNPSANNRMMSVRADPSSGALSQKNQSSFYQNSKPNKNCRRDTLV